MTIRRCLLGLLGMLPMLTSCATQEHPEFPRFGDLISVAPDRTSGVLIARSLREGALLQFVESYVAKSDGFQANPKAVYLSTNTLPELSRSLVLQKGQEKVSLDYFSRHTRSSDEVALILLDQITSAGMKGSPKLIVLRFDERTGSWKEN